MSLPQVKIQKQRSYHTEIVGRFKNYNLMLYGFLFSIATLFLVCCSSYVYVRWGVSSKQQLYISNAFMVNTLVIFVSSLLLRLTSAYFYDHNYNWYKMTLLATFVSGWVFLIGQLVGWIDTWNHEFTIHNVAAAFLYVITGLHAVHLLAGMAFLTYFSFQTFKKLSHFAYSVVYFTDPVAEHQLKNFAIYWHFLTGVWLIVFSIVYWVR